MNTDATANAEEYYRPTQRARMRDVSGLPAMIRASVITDYSVITFVVVCKVQLSVYFTYLRLQE